MVVQATMVQGAEGQRKKQQKPPAWQRTDSEASKIDKMSRVHRLQYSVNSLSIPQHVISGAGSCSFCSFQVLSCDAMQCNAM